MYTNEGDVTTFKTPIEYKQAVAYTLAQVI